MGKLALLAILAIASFARAPEGAAMPKPQLGISPNPMKAGGTATITGPAGKVVYLDWNPSGAGTGRVVLDENGEAEIDVPNGTGSVVVSANGCTGTAATYGP